jgi:hypothetical protein
VSYEDLCHMELVIYVNLMALNRSFSFARDKNEMTHSATYVATDHTTLTTAGSPLQ